MATAFDDLIPAATPTATNHFADLIPSDKFGDLIPKAPAPSRSFLSRIWDGAISRMEEFEHMEVAPLDKPMMESFVTVPRTGEEGTIQRGISETVAGVVEGTLSPGGVLLAASTLVPGGPQIVGGTMAGLMAKQAGQQLGEASVTGNRQTATEGVMAAVLAPLTMAAVAGPEFVKAARIRGEQATAALNQADLAARSAMRTEPPQEPPPPPRSPTTTASEQPPLPEGVTLDDVYKRFEPEKKPLPTAGEIKTTVVEGVRTGLSSKYRPLDKLAEDIAGTAEPKRVAEVMEQLAGSSGKAEADVYRFDRAVSDLVKGNEKDFNAYVFLRRSIDRLQMDAADLARAAAGEEVATINRRRVSEYTIPQLEAKLQLLESNLSPEVRAKFEAAADAFQQHMDKALSLQVESGRMSQEVYNDIRIGNQFYAPFKILKYIEETSRPEGSGRKVDTTADYTKAITGIDDPNFKLGDMLAAARRNLTMSRILSDKNLAMQKVAQLAADDPQGVFIRKLGATEKAARDKADISVLENGKVQRYEVNEDVAAALQTYNSAATDLLARGLSFVQRPLKLGATGLNVAFQPVNLLFADLPRAALVSKYGVKTPADLMRFPLDWVHAFYTSMKPRVTGRASQLYLDFLDSGAAGSTVQDFLSPEALRFPAKSKLAPSNLLNTVEDFGRAIEEISKIVGVKRAMRETGATTGAELQKNFPEAITEVRRFSGSPDFWRQGKWTEAARLNLIFNFFNARLQGAIADVGRLAGRDGLKTALETNAKVGVAVGVPTVLAYLYNNLPQYAADYAQRPKNERDNYWLIPKDTYITDDNGNKIRDYWRIPKRELGKLVANTMEAGMRYAQERDPAAFWALGMNLLENLSPISIEGRTSGERIESMVSSLNPVLKAPIELGTGRDMFRHRDIVPDVMKQASPEEQYVDRTPALFKRLANGMPDVLPELVRSPLMLENITVNFTAGLITQFLAPEKPVKGREGIAASRFMRRFQAVPYTENVKVTEELNSLKREAADEFLKRDRTAKAALSDGKPLEDALNLVKDTGDIKLLRRTIDLWLAQQNGITFDERRILSLPVEQRAQFVANQLLKLDADAKAKLLEDYVRKRILTADVLDQLSILLNPENK